MICKVDHSLDARAETEGTSLFQCDGLAVRDADLARRGYRAKAAGKEQQFTPRIDQQRYLIVNLSHHTIVFISLNINWMKSRMKNPPGCF